MERQYVGIDLHRRRSVVVRMDGGGEVLAVRRIDNDPAALSAVIAEAGPEPEVVLEATYGWYWAVDVLRDYGATVHLAHPLGVKAFAYQRVKKDETDASLLADLLRMGRLPEAWIAPPALRELRELVRYRMKLVNARSNLKFQAYGVLAKEGVRVPMSDLFGKEGLRLLDNAGLRPSYRLRVGSLRRLVADLDLEVSALDKEIARTLRPHPGYQVIQTIPGVGSRLAAVFIAELGDVGRFAGAAQVCSWAGLTPKHRESDQTVHRGHITKQGSRLVRWAAVEAASTRRRGKFGEDFDRIAKRRGRPIARVALARKILTLVYYGLRDGEVRCLAGAEE